MSLMAWLWNQCGDDLAALAKESVKQLWQRIHWEEIAQRYREKVIVDEKSGKGQRIPIKI